MKEGNLILTVDVGGTKIKAITFSESKKVIEEKIALTSSFKCGSERFLEDLITWVSNLNLEKVSDISVALNCPVYNDRITFSSLAGGEVKVDFVERLREVAKKNIYLENDVYALAQGVIEVEEESNFTVINLGTGVRLANVRDQKVYKGSTGNAGEISQMKIYIREIDQFEKIDNVVSGKGIENLYHKLTGKTLGAKEIFKSDEESCVRVKKIFYQNLYRLIQQISFFYNPAKIILSSSVSDSIREEIKIINSQIKNEKYHFLYPSQVKIMNDYPYVNYGLFAKCIQNSHQ